MNVPSLSKIFPRSLRSAILIVLLAEVLVFSLAYAVTYVNEDPAAPLQIIMNPCARARCSLRWVYGDSK
jgi:hypothetical protein